MVQVLKEPFGTKGPRVTTNIMLPGRYTVLLPNAEYIGISRRIEDEEERSRLKKVVDMHKPPNMGIIVRTAAEGTDEEVLANDIKFLLKLWEKIKQAAKSGPVPRCIHKDLDLIGRTVRDMFLQNISRFVINDKSACLNVLEMVDMISPSLKQKVVYFDKDYDLFGFYNIESKIERALSRKVWLKSGGYIVIDRTEALTVIDVNTGKYIGGHDLEETVLKTNMEAAKEIARQLRVRDIGGIIIIDFIDMHKAEHRSMVIDELKAALKNDRTKTTVLGLTGLGLVEMTRKKVRQDLDSVLNIGCPHCEGTGRIPSQWTILRQMEKDISRVASHTPNAENVSIRIDLHPSVVSFINEKNKGLVEKLEKKYNIKMQLNPSDKVKYSDVKITVIDN